MTATFRRWCNHNAILTKWVSLTALLLFRTSYFWIYTQSHSGYACYTSCLCYSYKASFCPSVSQTKPLRAPSNQKQSVSWGWRQWTCVLAPRFSTTGIEQACSLQQALVSGCPRLGISVPVYGTLIHETVSGLKSRALVSSLNSDTTWPCVFGQPTWTF